MNLKGNGLQHDQYEIYALKYAERNARARKDSFVFDDDHASPHPMDYFFWVVRNKDRTFLVDTGYDRAEGTRRDRPILEEPASMLARLNLKPEDITDVIVTHLHYDHAGGLDQFEHAKLHMQEAELAYAVGACMCHEEMRAPFTADHICSTVKRLYSGKVQFYTGTAQIAPGILVHQVGGHSKGLQVVEVKTARGPVILASDASHYYENYQSGKIFPIVADVKEMLDGFHTLRRLAPSDDHIIPGHDPLVRQLYPSLHKGDDLMVRLDLPPKSI